MYEQLIAATFGLIVGGLLSWVTTNSRLRRELELLYDRDLREKRVAAYTALWRRTKRVPRHRLAGDVTGKTLREIREDWHTWYYDVGGIYMSELVRSKYFDATEALEHAADIADDSVLSPDQYDPVYARVKALRDALTGDIGARLDPKLSTLPRRQKLPGQ